MFEKKLIKIKHQSFGKYSGSRVKLNPKTAKLKKSKQMAVTEEEKEEIDDKIGKVLIEEKCENVERQMEFIKSKSKMHQSQVFKVRNMITINSNNKSLDAIVDPKSKEYIIDKDKILQATLEYAAGVLQNATDYSGI